MSEMHHKIHTNHLNKEIKLHTFCIFVLLEYAGRCHWHNPALCEMKKCLRSQSHHLGPVQAFVQSLVDGTQMSPSLAAQPRGAATTVALLCFEGQPSEALRLTVGIYTHLPTRV